MPNINVGISVQRQLNRCMPAAAKAKLGDVLIDVVKQVNSLTVAVNATLAKLDAAGATVTGLGTNYVSTLAVPATPLLDIESRY